MTCTGEGGPLLVVTLVMVIVASFMAIESAIQRQIRRAGRDIYSRLSPEETQSIDVALNQLGARIGFSGCERSDPIIRRAWGVLSDMESRSARRFLAIIGGICERHERERLKWK